MKILKKKQQKECLIKRFVILICKKAVFCFYKENVNRAHYHSLINRLHYRTIIPWITNEIGSRTS